ncbi:hypothetical protein M9979_12295 [Sphingomonas sp. RP10(2022)]|uniref:Winged helix DNA-binding domain-containing protein n=1 Tax=Sphingomonas liriopis TaxID=2949094 RepID=A0A9X2KQE1_9SPHN|nr:hypothetical protein [Sphingomonas liriopis]MCP3735654.1 hypothetical protein [Sphingomonas liriopis]
MTERMALQRLAWARQTADPADKALNALEQRGYAIRTGHRPGGKVEWRITAAGAERLYPQLREHAPAVAA